MTKLIFITDQRLKQKKPNRRDYNKSYGCAKQFKCSTSLLYRLGFVCSFRNCQQNVAILKAIYLIYNKCKVYTCF